MDYSLLQSLFISPDSSIRSAMQCVDRGSCGIALVVDRDRHLLGTITDGDLRRAILSGGDLELPVSVILASKISSQYPKPVTVQLGMPYIITLLEPADATERVPPFLSFVVPAPAWGFV